MKKAAAPKTAKVESTHTVILSLRGFQIWKVVARGDEADRAGVHTGLIAHNLLAAKAIKATFGEDGQLLSAELVDRKCQLLAAKERRG